MPCIELYVILFYYIYTSEIPEFFLLLKIISSSCAVKILFFSFTAPTCEDNRDFKMFSSVQFIYLPLRIT